MGARLRLTVFVVSLMGVSALGRAETLIFLQVEPSETVQGAQYRETDATSLVSVTRQFGSEIWVQGASLGPSNDFLVLVRFAAANGAELVPGSYENASDQGGDVPKLSLFNVASGCSGDSGRFVVHDLVRTPSDEILSFSADFEQQCAGSSRVSGAIRFHSGASGCSGLAEGAPCDDLDPCTTADECLAGECMGMDTVSSTCTAEGPCRPPGLCAPMTGTCLAATTSDGVSCDDGDVCTVDDACAAGVCMSDDVLACSDDDPCTFDTCDPIGGCVNDLVDGTCWATRAVVRVAASASAGGRSAHCSGKCEVPGEGSLILYDDGTYLVPGGQLIDCAGGTAVDVPDEVGVVRPVRRRSFVLEPTNEDALFAAAAECVQEANPFRSYRARLKLAKDGETLRGRSTVKGRIGGRIPVRIKMTAKIRGALVGGPEIPPVTRKPLPSCAEPIRIRCRTS